MMSSRKATGKADGAASERPRQAYGDPGDPPPLRKGGANCVGSAIGLSRQLIFKERAYWSLTSEALQRNYKMPAADFQARSPGSQKPRAGPGTLAISRGRPAFFPAFASEKRGWRGKRMADGDDNACCPERNRLVWPRLRNAPRDLGGAGSAPRKAGSERRPERAFRGRLGGLTASWPAWRLLLGRGGR